MELRFRVGSRIVELVVSDRDGRTVVSVDGREVVVEDSAFDERSATVTIGGRRHRVLFDVERGHVFAAHGGQAWEFIPGEEAAADQEGGAFDPLIISPMPGKVLQVLVQAGDHVATGAGLLILEAMKMENRLVAEAPAKVAEVRVTAGQTVDGGQVLVVLEYEEEA